MKQRSCRVCRTKFPPWNSLQIVCGAKCALTYFKDQDRKRIKQEKREGLVRLRTRTDWVKVAQVAFNRYIRERDKYRQCISCSATGVHNVPGGSWDCGHYRSTGANPELRFEELNAHKQCKQCNKHLSGNVVNYRIGLCARVGIENVEWLEGPHQPKKYTVDDLKVICRTYRDKLKVLRQQVAA